MNSRLQCSRKGDRAKMVAELTCTAQRYHATIESEPEPNCLT